MPIKIITKYGSGAIIAGIVVVDGDLVVPQIHGLYEGVDELLLVVLVLRVSLETLEIGVLLRFSADRFIRIDMGRILF